MKRHGAGRPPGGRNSRTRPGKGRDRGGDGRMYMARISQTRRQTLLAGAALAALTLGIASSAQAQGGPNAQPPAPDAASNPNDPNDAQEITVTGFRASLESAVNEKKRRDQVVESISA